MVGLGRIVPVSITSDLVMQIEGEIKGKTPQAAKLFYYPEISKAYEIYMLKLKSRLRFIFNQQGPLEKASHLFTSI